MRKYAWIIAAAALAISLSACSRNGSDVTEPIQLNADEKQAQTVTMIIAQGRYKDVYKKMFSKMKSEENITVQLEVVPDAQYNDLATTKIAAREVPDIMVHIVPQRYYEFDAPKNMLDLSGEPWIGRLTNPDMLKHTDGVIYAMPIEAVNFYAAAYYNKKVFAELNLSEPTTYAEFLNVLETIKTKGGGITPIYMSNKDDWTTQVFMTAGLSVLLGEKAQSTFNRVMNNQLKWTEIPEFKTILSEYAELYEKGYVNQDHVGRTFEEAKAAIASGNAAMVYNGEWTVSELVTKHKMSPSEIGAFVIPFGDNDIMATGGFVTGLFIPKDAKNKETAKKVLNLLSQPAYLDIYFAEHPGSPGFTDVNGGVLAPEVKGLEEAYIRGNKYVYEMNYYVSFVSAIFHDALWRYYVELAAGLKTPEQVIEAWQISFEDYMEQKKQPGF